MIDRDFYMDDLISGLDNFDSTIDLISKIIKILDSGKFPLRQWTSNKPKIFENLKLNCNSSQFMVKDTSST